LAIEIMRDSEIEQWVLRHLGLLELADSREVCIVSHEGIVTLYGTVANQASKLAMHRAAHDARGVIAVISNLQSESSEPYVSRFVTSSMAKVSRGMSVRPPVRRGVSRRRAIGTY
jgi:BON domain